MKILKLQRYIRTCIVIILMLYCSPVLPQAATLAKKGILEASEFAVRKISVNFEKKTVKELLSHYSSVYVKNGLGKNIRMESNSIQTFLEETYVLRGKEELIRVGDKISTLNPKNLNSIKGFIAEEMHHNELLKNKGVQNIQIGVKSKTTKSVKKAQEKYIAGNLEEKKDLYIHKLIELDIIAKKNNSKFLIEVKNIDSPFTKDRFRKCMNQLVKQKAYAIENGIKKVYWSNIGVGKLSPEQIQEVEKLGVEVFQNGSTSPMVNAKMNMLRINKAINKLE